MPVPAHLLDRAAIREVLHRYGSALDAKDWDRLRSVFLPETRALYAGQDEWLVGGEAIVSWIDAMTQHTPWQHHFLSVQEVELAGDRAVAVTYLVSSQRTDDPEPVLVRMLGTYHDVLVRAGDGWRISERRLVLGWAERSVPPAA